MNAKVIKFFLNGMLKEESEVFVQRLAMLVEKLPNCVDYLACGFPSGDVDYDQKAAERLIPGCKKILRTEVEVNEYGEPYFEISYTIDEDRWYESDEAAAKGTWSYRPKEDEKHPVKKTVTTSNTERFNIQDMLNAGWIVRYI